MATTTEPRHGAAPGDRPRDLPVEHPAAADTAVEWAVAAARARAVAAGSRVDSAWFGPGRVAVALVGRLDRPGVDAVERLLRQLRPWTTDLLVLDTAALRDYHPRLGRIVGRTRVHCLVDQVPLLVRALPVALADELDLPASGPATPGARRAQLPRPRPPGRPS